MKKIILIIIFLHSFLGFTQIMDISIEETPPYKVGQSVNLKFFIENDTTVAITYFDSRGPSWDSFKEEWILRINNKFAEVLPLNGRFESKFTDSIFITILPGEKQLIRTKQFKLATEGLYTLIYKQEQSRKLIKKEYADTTVTDSLIQMVTQFKIGKTIQFEVDKSYDTTINNFHNMTWEEWREYRNVKLYSRKKHFDNMYAALKYPEDVYALTLTGKSVDAEILKRIGELKNLRALSIRDFTFEIFPKEIAELKLYELTIIPQKDIVVNFPYGMSKDSSIRELTAKFYGGGVPQTVLNLHKLIYLNISNCPITTLPNLSSLKRLKELVANNAEIKSIDSSSFKELKSLKKLNLSGNKKLDNLMPILSCTNLESLIINRTSIKIVPNEIENLSKLKRVAISNSVTYVSDSIGNLDDMRYLSFGGNRRLDSIPNSILKMNKLLHFDINNTNITVLPEGISELPLEQVRVYNTNCRKTKDYRVLKKRLGVNFKE